jgi:serine O-acetyltransferase
MTKAELHDCIKEDKQYYYGNGLKRIYRILTHNPLYRRGEYIITCRKAGFYSNNQKGLFDKLQLVYYTRKRNILGEKLHIEFGPAQFGRRLRIYHNDIIVNAGAIIGDDCELYGNNCIGNKGSEHPALAAPQLGDGVSLGVGASIIGAVHIADGTKISGMTFVNKDLSQPYSLWGGVPAKYIRDL